MGCFTICDEMTMFGLRLRSSSIGIGSFSLCMLRISYSPLGPVSSSWSVWCSESDGEEIVTGQELYVFF